MLRLSSKSPPALKDLLHSPVERAAAEVSYWALDRYYALDCGAVERLLIPAVRDLWTTCLDFVARAVGDDEILSSLGIPEHAWTSIADSWTCGDPAPLARFDLSFDGRTPPKLHECNIDVAGLLYEATFFQRSWMDHQRNCEPSFSGCGQFTEIEEALASALASPAARGPLALVSVGSDPYEELWISTIGRILEERGIACDFARLGSVPAFLAWASERAIVTPDLYAVKAFRWDLLLAHEEQIRSLTDRQARLISPMWSLVLSSKGCLPWLWRMNPGHPNLLEACFTEEGLLSSQGFVSKPLFSIQGQNINLRDTWEPSRNLVTGGRARGARRVYQELCYLPQFSSGSGQRWASTGAWVANGRPAGISMTEASSPVITEASMRYVPHVLR